MAVNYTAIDHGVAAPDRPHVVLFYESMRERGVAIRYNYPEAMLDCLIDRTLWEDWGGELPYNHVLPAELLGAHALPEDVSNVISRGLPAFGLLWDMWGPFDLCPKFGH